MKLTSALFLSLLSLLPLTGGETISAARNIVCRKEALEVRRTPIPVWDGLRDGKTGKTSAERWITGKKDGAGAMVLRIESGDRTIPPQAEKFVFLMEGILIHARKAVPGWEGRYSNTLEWLDKKGKILSTVPLDFPNKNRPEAVTEGPVPKEAVKVRLAVSCTIVHPEKGDGLRLKQLKLGFLTPASALPSEGMVRSMPRPFRKAETIRWIGECPPGTELLFQVSTAPDSKGVPGPWSAFTGPEGKPEEWYMALSGRDLFSRFSSAKLEKLQHEEGWIRWRAKLVANPGAKTTPLLKKVEIAGNLWEEWGDLKDRTEPVIRFFCQSPSHKKRLSFVFQILENDSIDEKSIRLSVDGKPDNRFIRVGNSIQYRPAVPWKAGLHKAEITLADVNGNRVSRTGFFYIGPAEKNRSSVTLRPDGAILINTKFFFPVGVCSAAKNPLDQFSWDKTFQRLQASGINTAHLRSDAGAKERKEFMDAADRYKMRLFLDLPLPALPENTEENLKNLLPEKQRESLFAWNLSHCTADCFHPEEVNEVREALKNTVPGRLISQSDRIGNRTHSRYRAFTRSTDVFLPEIFPVTANTPEVTDRCVAEAAADMRQVLTDLGRGKRPALLPVVQFFEDGKQWKRFPILRELRAMSFAVLCSGANGILWSSYSSEPSLHGIPYSEETVKALSSVAKEITALSDLWETPLPVQPATPKILSGPKVNLLGDPAIVYVLRKSEKRAVLIAVNTVNAPVRAKFTLPDKKQTVLDLGPFGVEVKNIQKAEK